MILTRLPDLPPRPESAANALFRRQFYARWGRENAVVCGRSTLAEYAAMAQTLSIKMALGGRERYLLPRRELVVDDDTLLVLNEGARYGSVLQSERPAWSFAVFFRPGMQHEVAAQQARGLQAALDDPGPPGPAQPVRPIGFAEHLRPRQGPVGARLQQMAQQIAAGERSEAWLEEQLTLLLADLLKQEHAPPPAGSTRPALRAELRRRLLLAADLIQSHDPQALTLDRLAAEASLSRFHFVREFSRLFGASPHAYLTRKRARVAQRLLAAGATDPDRVAQACGLGSRWSLRRALARHGNEPAP
ncbi:MAG: helix-turn-helix domain-containing protein [Aquabacterium sp.]